MKPDVTVSLQDQIAQKALALFEAANLEKIAYLADLKEVAKETQTIYPDKLEGYAVKSVKSLIEKIELKGINSTITDALRFTLVLFRQEDLTDILTSLQGKGYKVYKDPDSRKEDITNRFEDPTPGYKDIAIKLVKRTDDTLVKELQLLQAAMLKAKMELGHDLYKQDKAFEKQLQAASLIENPEERETFRQEILEDRKIIQTLSNRLYQKAYYLDNPNFF